MPVLLTVLSASFLVAGCTGPQSALDPAGRGAEWLATLFWVMLTGAGIVWCLVIGLAIYATVLRPREHSEKTASRLIIWGGVAFPTVVLTALLVYGLSMMPDLRASGTGLRISVSGEQFWWRVRYWPEGAAEPIESANEIRLPVGASVEVELDSPDVIHSFWIPVLAGKVDMVPGRTNRILLEPTRAGIYRGVCAEFCGKSHALMAFSVVVMEQPEFDRWLAREAGVSMPGDPAGRDAFIAAGCGACHTVRGTLAAGKIGPDLTHFGSRRTIGAGILANEPDNLVRFIAETEAMKPGARMPSFRMLPEGDLDAIAAYLGSLQ